MIDFWEDIIIIWILHKLRSVAPVKLEIKLVLTYDDITPLQLPSVSHLQERKPHRWTDAATDDEFYFRPKN